MSDRYISKHAKPTPYEREILTIMIEECGEVIQAATKMLRFGAGDGYPGQSETNSENLSKEIGDLLCMVEMATTAEIVDEHAIEVATARKSIKVLQFMQEKP